MNIAKAREKVFGKKENIRDLKFDVIIIESLLDVETGSKGHWDVIRAGPETTWESWTWHGSPLYSSFKMQESIEFCNYHRLTILKIYDKNAKLVKIKREPTLFEVIESTKKYAQKEAIKLRKKLKKTEKLNWEK
jgi:hypothetical protein